MSVVEMKIIKWMSGMTRKYRKRNEYVKGRIGVASIVDTMRENRLRLFGHVCGKRKRKQ